MYCPSQRIEKIVCSTVIQSKKKEQYLQQGWVRIAAVTMAALSEIDDVDNNRMYSDALACIKNPESVGHAELYASYQKALKSSEMN